MKHCKHLRPCWDDGICRLSSHCDYEVITNADKIRNMTDEELADILREFAVKPMQGSFLKWLQQPAEDVPMQPKITERTMYAIAKMGRAAHGEIDFDYGAEDDNG